jgi:rod shape-determining protein MreB
MLHHFIRQANRSRRPVQPRAVISVPSGITQVERRAVQESAMHAGARKVHLVPQPVAGAMGAGLRIAEPGASMIVDVGGGTTEVAVISLSGIVHSTSLRIGGDDMNDAIAQHVRKSHGLLIGERRAEEIKITLGSAHPHPDDAVTMPVKGRDLTSGLPRTIVVTGVEVREALREPITAIVQAVRVCLEQTPPELAADIVDNGITLTGGGALLAGLDGLLNFETDLPIVVAEDPLTCVVRGAGQVLDDPASLDRVAFPL